MNKHLFSYVSWKAPLESSWWSIIAIFTLVLGLILTGCVDSPVVPEVENSPDTMNPQQTLLVSTPSPWTSTPSPVFTASSEPETTPSAALNTIMPTWTPTTIPTVTPTPDILPELLIAMIEVKQKGEANEFHEIWLVNTLTGEKRLTFTTSSGTRRTQMLWGEEQANILYVSEIKGLEGENPTWQLYAVNYESGNSQAFFAEPMKGVPRLLDMSAQGKWLRIWVDYFETASFEWWFIHTEDGTVVKNDPDDRYLSGFVWSPDEPDVFAYFEEATLEGDTRIPQSIVLSEVPDLEPLDIIEHQYTSFRSEPLLMWGLLTPEQIMFLTPGETYMVDLSKREWTQIAQDLDVFPGDGSTQILQSPSGQWAVTTTFIRIIQLQDTMQVVEHLEDRVGHGHLFLAWYDDQDWIVIATQDGKVQVYELGNLRLIREIDLHDYGFTSPRSASILAQPLK